MGVRLRGSCDAGGLAGEAGQEAHAPGLVAPGDPPTEGVRELAISVGEELEVQATPRSFTPCTRSTNVT